MSRTVRIVLLLNLAAVAALVFVYPHLMVSPGRLIEGHRAYERNCFTCHDGLFGASSRKCVSCHKVEDIGLRTTRGTPLSSPRARTGFHRQLLGQDCVACHSDHAGVAKYRIRPRFSHELLETQTRAQCASCHRKPADNLHQLVPELCSRCHVVEKWKPALFRHDMLAVADRDKCVTCHKARIPDDPLHRQASDKCGQCHGVDRWKPSTFDHAKYFRFDKRHPAKCATCHTTDNYKQYTCYGCHEHSPRKIRKEHLEEGIRDFENCVTCHRSSSEAEAKRAWRSIRRGIPYRFDVPSEQPEKKRKRKKRGDDD